MFGFESPNDEPGNASPVSRVLEKNSSLTKNPFGTNTEPFLINCDAVCQIDFIVVLHDAGSFCKNNLTDWKCGLIGLEENITEIFNTRAGTRPL